MPEHEQTKTGLSFRSLKLISLSQVGLSFHFDLKFTCKQKIFSFRGEMTFQSKRD